MLHPRRIRCGLETGTKEEVLRELAGLVASTTEGLSADDLLGALTDREKQGPFSMARGAAFPHARTEKVSEFTVALGTSRGGVDFRAPDGKPVHIAVLFVIPKQHSNLYLHTLAAFLSFLQVEEHVRRVLDAKTGEEMISVIDEFGPKPKDPSCERLPYRPAVPAQLDTTVAQAFERLKRSGLADLPIVDTTGDLLGEVHAGALRRVAEDPKTKGSTPLSGFPDLLVREPLSTIQENESPQEAARRIAGSGGSSAYVLRGRRLLGRIGAGDLPKP
ncbi:MAG: PTS sugar transporter subunit IIA [Planctomycetota bacterium]